MEKDENMDWKKEASHLASLPITNPYRVPDKYFDELTSRINQSVFLDVLMQKENQGFSVPENYFQELGASIEAKIATDQIKSLVDTEGFKTPDNYFDKLNAEILSKTVAAPKAKVFRLWNSDVMRYAAAACFVVLAASGLYLNNQNTTKQLRSTEIASEQMLYDIDETVIIEHLQESQNVTTNTASDTEMENYILNHYTSSDLSNNL